MNMEEEHEEWKLRIIEEMTQTIMLMWQKLVERHDSVWLCSLEFIYYKRFNRLGELRN